MFWVEILYGAGFGGSIEGGLAGLESYVAV